MNETANARRDLENIWTREPGDYRFELLAGESVRDPTRTKRRIYGPAVIEYRVWPDGGIDGLIVESGSRGR